MLHESDDTASGGFGVTGGGRRLTVREAAAYAGVCAGIIYSLCSSRALPHLRVGAPGKREKVLINPSDLDAYREACKVRPEQPAAAPIPKPQTKLVLKHLRLKSP